MHLQLVVSQSSCDTSASRRPEGPTLLQVAAFAALLAAALPVHAQTLPAGWSSSDVGGPSLSGSASHASGVFSVEAAGTDIWDPADQFHFAYRQLSGDVDLRARVDSLIGTHHWAKAGVMIRGGLSSTAPHAYALVSPERGLAFQRRASPGGPSAHTAGAAVTAPRWVRLVRTGTTVAAYASADGVQWTELGRDTIALGTVAYVGLAVTSHNPGLRTTARFSNVTALPLGLPAGQTNIDIGAPAVRGTAQFANGAYTVTGAGVDIWGTADQFHFVYQPVQGDVTITARVASVTQAHGWSKAGVMVRESLDADSRHAYALVSAGRGSAFQRRPTTGGESEHSAGASAGPPGWVRLVRTGTVFEAFQSADGQRWTSMGTRAIGMVETVYVGLAVTSHAPAQATTAVLDTVQIVQAQPGGNRPPAVSLTAPQPGATFPQPSSITLAASASDADGTVARVDFYAGSTLIASDTTAPYSVSWTSPPPGTHTLTAVAVDDRGAAATSAPVAITVTAVGLPAGQIGADIGAPAIRGQSSFAGGAYTISAGGVDIWDTADQFHFVYQPMVGDVTITARVASVTRAHEWSKAGVMIRETLTAGSRHAYALVSAGRGDAFQRRPAPGGISEHTQGGTAGAPRWVRLVRRGSVFESYSSADGQSWTLRGSRTISMAQTVYVGLAVTSHNVGAATTAVLDNLEIAAGTSNRPPVVSLTSPAAGATFLAPATISVTASASDPDGSVARVDFYAGTTLIGSDTTAPYAISWQPVAAGSYTLTAVARDTAGATTTSPAVGVTVQVSATEPPRGVVFTASPDHAALVTHYVLEVYASGATPGTSTPAATANLGKPVPASNGDITVMVESFFQTLPPGAYVAVVAAVGSGGSSRTPAVGFTR